MLDIAGLSLDESDRELLEHPAVGGLILFSRNFNSTSQLKELVASVRECRPEILIAVDQEGGRVQRFREGFLDLPALHDIGATLSLGNEKAEIIASSCGWAMAAELLHYGIDFSFAPVLDVYSGDSSVIADRAFSSNPEEVASLARAYVKGMHEAGMAATGKHYPGHGTVSTDSHVELPRDERSAEEIYTNDYSVFASCVDCLDAVMPAHVIYPSVDNVCAGFSRIWIQGKLRGELGFDGVVFSDDLSMAAAHSAGKIEDRVSKACEAGCDMILVCNDRPSAQIAAEWLEREIPLLNPRLQSMKADRTILNESLFETKKWLETKVLIESLERKK